VDPSKYPIVIMSPGRVSISTAELSAEMQNGTSLVKYNEV